MLENLSGFLAVGGEVHVRHRRWSAIVAEQVSCGVRCASAQCININDPTTVAFGAAGLKTPAAGENTPPHPPIHTHLIATWDKHV